MSKSFFSWQLFFLLLILSCFHQAKSQNTGSHFNSLANQYKKNNADSAVFYFNKSANQFIVEDSFYLAINAYNQAAIVLTRQDKNEEALLFLNQSLEIGKKMNDTISLEIATTYIAFGVIYGAQKKYNLSLSNHFKSLNIRLEKLGNFHSDIATNYGNIGNVFFNSGEYDSALVYHYKALEIRDSIFESQSNEITQSYTGLGNAYRELKNYDKSIFYFDAALQNKIKQFGATDKNLIPFYNRLIEVYKLNKDKENRKKYQGQVDALEKV